MSRRVLRPPPVYDAESSSSEESDGAEDPKNDDEDYDEVASGTEEDLEEKYEEAEESESIVGDEGSENANDVYVPLEEGDENIKWIHEHIDKLKDSEIGSFPLDNSICLHVMEAVKGARNKIDEPDNYAKICKEMTKLSKDKEFRNRLRSFSTVSEFIIHMHHVYEVNLNPNCSVDDGDSVLVGTIRSALGKS